jgi:predicted neuraminidase
MFNRKKSTGTSPIDHSSSKGEEFKPNPPKWLCQNYLYPMHSIEGRPGAHASQIMVGPLKDGVQTLYTVWFCGTGEGNLDVAVMFCEITYRPEEVLKMPEVEENDPFEPISNGLFHYSEPKIIADMPNRACGNPVLYMDENNRFHLWFAAFYTRGSKIPKGEEMGRRDIFYQFSDDHTLTWSKPTIWSDRPGLWVRNALVVLKNGTWILPINDEESYLPEYDCKWSSRFAFSYDKGQSWKLDEELYSIHRLPDDERGGIIQPSVVQLNDDTLYCMNRSHTRHIVEMRSNNNGESWTTPVDSKLPNPQCNVCVTNQKLAPNSDKTLLLIYNPSTWGRDPISIARSVDNGQNWTCLFDLRHETGELSYPCMVETPDGLIHCTYTLHRMTIAHDIFLLDDK